MPTVDPRKEEPESLLVRVCSFVGVMGLAFLIGGFGAALRPYFRQPDEYESSRDYNEERDRLHAEPPAAMRTRFWAGGVLLAIWAGAAWVYFDRQVQRERRQ